MKREIDRFLVRGTAGRQYTVIEYETFEKTGDFQNPDRLTVARRSYRIVNGNTLGKLPDGSFQEDGTGKIYHRI